MMTDQHSINEETCFEQNTWFRSLGKRLTSITFSAKTEMYIRVWPYTNTPVIYSHLESFQLPYTDQARITWASCTRVSTTQLLQHRLLQAHW